VLQNVRHLLGISPGTNAHPQLYQMVCTGWMPSTYEVYQPVQMSVLLVVSILNYYERQRWSWSRRLAGEGWQSWSMQGASSHRLLFCFFLENLLVSVDINNRD
jgi:hypothetical protein